MLWLLLPGAKAEAEPSEPQGAASGRRSLHGLGRRNVAHGFGPDSGDGGFPCVLSTSGLWHLRRPSATSADRCPFSADVRG